MKPKTHERSPYAFWINVFLFLLANVFLGFLIFGDRNSTSPPVEEIKPTDIPAARLDIPAESSAMTRDLTLIAMIGMCLWPILFDFTVGYKIIGKCPLLVFVFLLPLVTGVIEQMTAGEKKSIYVSDANSEVKPNLVKGDIAVLITIAFILVTLMNNKKAQHMLRHTSPLMIIALILVIGFIIPTGDLSVGNHVRRAMLIQAGQKICLNWAVGAVLGVLVLLLCAYQKQCRTSTLKIR